MKSPILLSSLLLSVTVSLTGESIPFDKDFSLRSGVAKPSTSPGEISLANQVPPERVRPPLAAADAPRLAPNEVLEADGTLTLCDGSSYFMFFRDGAFLSEPVDGMNGRTFEGRWTASPGLPNTFRVDAKLGWLNGASSPDQYRIVFVVYSGHKRTADRSHGSPHEKPLVVWDGYFIIDELFKVSKVDADFPWQTLTLQPGKTATVAPRRLFVHRPNFLKPLYLPASR